MLAAIIVVAPLAMGAMGCSRADWRTEALAPRPLSSPASGDSMSPHMTTSSRGLLLSWLERSGDTTTLKFAERSSSGWTEPIRVTSGNLVTNYADVPSVVRMSDGSLAAHWTVVTNPLREGTDLLLSFSRDNGQSWSSAVSPHHDKTPTQHAFATLFELPSKELGVIWLDARGYDLDQSDNIGLWYAAFDTAFQQIADKAIDSRVCECCPTTAALTSAGVLTAYRNRSDDEIRDIYVSRLENGTWSEGRAVHDDGWMIEGCPVNGPVVSARGQDAVVAWYTAKDDEGRAFAAFSSDAGRTWGNPIRLDDVGSLGRVGVQLLDDGSAVASWVEYENRQASLRARRLDRMGAKSPAATVATVSASATAGYQRLGRVGDEILFAWTERLAQNPESEGSQQVKMAVARVSQ
jgi:hypothetical protein